MDKPVSRILNKHRQEFDHLLEIDERHYDDVSEEESSDEEIDDYLKYNNLHVMY
jgi:hypothetical protein